jgi:hypothetical protein
MKNSIQISLLALILLICSCRKKELSSYVDQHQIFQDLWLSYDDASNSTYASARFFLGSLSGSRLELSQNSRVFYNGIELKKNSKRGTLYATAFNGYSSGFNFDWNDTEGRHFVNQAEIPAPIYGYNQTMNSWSAPTWGYDLYFDGDSIGVDEEVKLTIEVNQDTSFTIEIFESRQGRTFVHIPAWDVQRIIDFAPRFYLTRIRYRNLPETTAVGGRMGTAFVSGGSWLYVW